MNNERRYALMQKELMDVTRALDDPRVHNLVTLEEAVSELVEKYRSAVRTLQDIASMSGKIGSETAAHRLAMLKEPRNPDDNE